MPGEGSQCARSRKRRSGVYMRKSRREYRGILLLLLLLCALPFVACFVPNGICTTSGKAAKPPTPPNPAHVGRAASQGARSAAAAISTDQHQQLSKKELLQLVGTRGSSLDNAPGILDAMEPFISGFSVANCAVALFALAQAARTPQVQRLLAQDERFERLLHRTTAVLADSLSATTEGGREGEEEVVARTRDVLGLIQNLGALNVDPSPALHAALVQEADRLLPSCEPSELSGLLLSLAAFSHPLSPEFLQHYSQVTGERLTRMDGKALVSTLKGLAMVNHNPGLAWMDAWVREVELQLPGLDAASLATTVKGLAVLKHHPGRPFLDLFISSQKTRITGHTTNDLTITINSLFHLSFLPPPSYLSSFTAHAINLLPSFTPREIACTANGYAGLGSMVFGKAFLESFMAKCQWQVTGMGPRELAGLSSAVAILQAKPTPAFIDVFIRECMSQLSSFTHKDLHKIVTALARFEASSTRGAKSLGPFLEALSTRAEGQVEQFLPHELININEALQVLGAKAPAALVEAADKARKVMEVEANAFSAAQ